MQKHQKMIASSRTRRGIRKEQAAIINVDERRIGVGTTSRPAGNAEYQVKKMEPSIIAHIKAANIIPKGRSEPLPFNSCASRNAGNLKKIHRYIDPSQKHVVIANAHSRSSRSMFISKAIRHKIGIEPTAFKK